MGYGTRVRLITGRTDFTLVPPRTDRDIEKGTEPYRQGPVTPLLVLGGPWNLSTTVKIFITAWCEGSRRLRSAVFPHAHPHPRRSTRVVGRRAPVYAYVGGSPVSGSPGIGTTSTCLGSQTTTPRFGGFIFVRSCAVPYRTEGGKGVRYRGCRRDRGVVSYWF